MNEQSDKRSRDGISLGDRVPEVVVIMGVSGSGKTTVGSRVAGRLGRRFVDADDHHPEVNIIKMAAGDPLDDRDREPWLRALNRLLRQAIRRHEPVVLACSALKGAHRRLLLDGLVGALIVHLSVPEHEARRRLELRRGHFMRETMVRSQFAALEVPRADEAVIIDAAAELHDVVENVLNSVSIPGPAE